MKRLILIPFLILTACAHHAHRQTVSQVAVTGHPVSATGLRNTEQLKEYRFGRYVDPGDVLTMHESHPVYRIETSAAWNLAPNSKAAVPAAHVTSLTPTSNRDAVLVELNKERAETRAFAEQTAALNLHLAAMSQAVAKTQDVAQQNMALTKELATVRDRLDSLDGQIRDQRQPPPPVPSPRPRTNGNSIFHSLYANTNHRKPTGHRGGSTRDGRPILRSKPGRRTDARPHPGP